MSELAANGSLHHVTYAERFYQWSRIRDFRDGSDQVKKQGTRYLPAPSGMDLKTEAGKADYHAYKERAAVYAVVDRTVNGIVGLAFQSPASFKVTPRMERSGFLKYLTTDGESAETLAKLLVDQLVSIGRFGLLVDLPSQESPENRAYVAKYYAEHIQNWKREFFPSIGRQLLTEVVLLDGREKVADKDILRLLRLVLDGAGTANPVYRIETWSVDEDEVKKKDNDVFSGEPDDTRTPRIAGETLPFIPFIFANPHSLQPEIEKPPVLDLVDVNRSHYVNSADYEHALYAGAHDTFYIIGRLEDQDKPKEIGGGTLWILPEATEEVGTLSAEGASMDALRDAMEDKENRMKALGARLIHEQSGQPETAEAIMTRTKESASVILSAVDQTNAAMSRAFKFAAIMMGEAPMESALTDEALSEVFAAVDKSFIEARMDWEDAIKAEELWKSGSMTDLDYYEKLRKGKILEPGTTFEEWLETVDAKRSASQPAPEPQPSDGDEDDDPDDLDE